MSSQLNGTRFFRFISIYCFGRLKNCTIQKSYVHANYNDQLIVWCDRYTRQAKPKQAQHIIYKVCANQKTNFHNCMIKCVTVCYACVRVCVIVAGICMRMWNFSDEKRDKSIFMIVFFWKTPNWKPEKNEEMRSRKWVKDETIKKQINGQQQ